MLLRFTKEKNLIVGSFQLVDILRALSSYDALSVLGRHWFLAELDLWMYTAQGNQNDAISAFLPETGASAELSNPNVSGERLLERSAVVHQFESGLFLRLTDPLVQTVLNSNYRLWRGPSYFQATNVDLEIRCGECQYELIVNENKLAEHLQGLFDNLEVVT